MRVTEHWHSLREAVDSPSLEIFINHLDMVLGILLEEELGPDDLKSSFLTSNPSAILCSFVGEASSLFTFLLHLLSRQLSVVNCSF